MKRFAIDALAAWKNGKLRKPLVLSGARQVGKTWLLKEFGRTHYAKLVYVNFDRTPGAAALFEGGTDFKRIFAGLQTLAHEEIVPGDTLVVLDEIQLCPDALRSLKYWNEDKPDYHVAAAGSLIGLAMAGGTGYPVGKTTSMELHPMTFAEFLAATGDEELSELVAHGDAKLLDAFHDTLCARLKDYLFTGGMPAAVAAFAENRFYDAARTVQNDILTDYARDFGKHAPAGTLPRIRATWRSLPAQLAKEDKRFVASGVAAEDGGGAKTRARDLRDPLEWLEAASLVHRVWNVTKPNLPLDAYRNHVFKLFGADAGLLGTQSRLAAETAIDGNRVFTEFKGALTEQFVQQELRAAGLEPFFYAAPGSQAEIDFLVETPAGVVPVEAKAERNLRSKSLKFYREKFSPAAAVRTSLARFERQDGLVNIPLYAISRIKDFTNTSQ